MMELIVSLLIGALIGWLASLFMKTDSQQGTLANIVVGIIGSILGAWLFGRVLGIGSAEAAGTLTITGVFYGVLGAAILIAILKSLRVLR